MAIKIPYEFKTCYTSQNHWLSTHYTYPSWSYTVPSISTRPSSMNGWYRDVSIALPHSTNWKSYNSTRISGSTLWSIMKEIHHNISIAKKMLQCSCVHNDWKNEHTFHHHALSSLFCLWHNFKFAEIQIRNLCNDLGSYLHFNEKFFICNQLIEPYF